MLYEELKKCAAKKKQSIWFVIPRFRLPPFDAPRIWICFVRALNCGTGKPWISCQMPRVMSLERKFVKPPMPGRAGYGRPGSSDWRPAASGQSPRGEA